MSEKIAVVICSSREDENRAQIDLLEFLGNRVEKRDDVEVYLLPPLVDLAADGPGMRRLRDIDCEMLVVGSLQSRAIRWLLDKNELQGPFVEVEPGSDAPSTKPEKGRTVWCLGLVGLDASEAVRACGDCLDVMAARMGLTAQSGRKSEAVRIEETTSTRWYPVVDRERCTNCLECLNFCLFGVFGLDDSESLAIDEPDACRPGCPACSRICPEAAIMFPDHHDPAISGNPRASSAGLKLDLSQLFGGGDPVDIDPAAIDHAAMAASERDRAMAEKKATHKMSERKTDDGVRKMDLDDLVDGLDELEL